MRYSENFQGLFSCQTQEKAVSAFSASGHDKAARGRLLSSQEPIRNYLTNFGWIRFCVLNVASHSA